MPKNDMSKMTRPIKRDRFQRIVLAALRAQRNDEELRLLYVAVTRAEENLFVSYPMVQYRRFMGEYFTSPSRFLDAVPEKLLESWSLVEESTPLQLGAGEQADSSTE